MIKENGELNFKILSVKLPAIGSMRLLPHQEFKGTAKSITVKHDGKYWQIIILAEYEDEATPDLISDVIKNALASTSEFWLRLSLKTTVLRASSVSVLIAKAVTLKLSFTVFSAISGTTLSIMLRL